MPINLKKAAPYIAGGALALAFAGCGSENKTAVHELANDWVTTVYSKDSNIQNARKQLAYVFEECSHEQGGKCTQYVFPGSEADVYRTAIRFKRGDKVTFNPGDLDSIRGVQ